MEGLIKCTVVPPTDLYHPVLPFRCNKKLLFCLCRTCASEQNVREPCRHLSDTERAISGTWVLDELRMAVSKGYRILEIHIVYEYEVTQYDAATGEGRLFSEYIDTFLKLKDEASGYPSWVRTPTDEDRYIEEFRQSEGFLLDKDKIEHNAFKRALAKLSKFYVGQIGGEPEENTDTVNFRAAGMYRFLATPGIEDATLLFVGYSLCWISW